MQPFYLSKYARHLHLWVYLCAIVVLDNTSKAYILVGICIDWINNKFILGSIHCIQKGAAAAAEDDEEIDEDIDFDDDDFEGESSFPNPSSIFPSNILTRNFYAGAVDEDDMIEHYLTEQIES